MAISPRLPDGFTQICTWYFDDVIAANVLLDALEEGEAEAKRQAKLEAKRNAQKP